MSDHLTREELESISNREFRGAGLFAWLKHLESCEECRAQITLPATEEVLERLKANKKLRPSSAPIPEK